MRAGIFVLDLEAIRKRDLTHLVPFVECWEQYYRGKDSQYFAALNVGGRLTPKNVKYLLSWKDPRWLSSNRKDGSENPHIARALEHLDVLNQYRVGVTGPSEFGDAAKKIFQSGIVWQAFLFHISRPAEWPIADQHVFRTYSALFGEPLPVSMDGYFAYAEMFRSVSATFRKSIKSDEDEESVVKTNKRLDRALLSFGQFLLAYDPRYVKPPSTEGQISENSN